MSIKESNSYIRRSVIRNMILISLNFLEVSNLIYIHKLNLITKKYLISFYFLNAKIN